MTLTMIRQQRLVVPPPLYGILMFLSWMTFFLSPFTSCEAFVVVVVGTPRARAIQSSPSSLFAMMGPLARAKKAMDPQDYNRVVQQKMKQEGLTREQAEEEYNAFLENPSFYYALDKKEEYYKSLGYKDLFDGMIGEAEKQGRGEEVRERLAQFRKTSQIKAYSVLVVFLLSFGYAYNLYHQDPTNFLPGLPIHEQLSSAS